MTILVFADTETTGINHREERLIEVACIVVKDRELTGDTFHEYVNPEKKVGAGAFRVHGISNAMLDDKPLFPEIAQGLVDVLKGRTFVAHNARFDVGFLNMEFERAGIDFRVGRDTDVLDTLKLAKESYPGAKNNLDALCGRLGVDRSKRTYHGALLDTELLVQVYLGMTSKQGRFSMDKVRAEKKKTTQQFSHVVSTLEEQDRLMHEEYMSEIMS